MLRRKPCASGLIFKEFKRKIAYYFCQRAITRLPFSVVNVSADVQSRLQSVGFSHLGWLGTLLFWLVPAPLLAQHYISKTFTANQGLPSSYVFTSFQDPGGYLWIGTYGGLSKFDGVRFKNFTVNDGLGSNQILAILQDNKKRIIAGTFFGVSIYDGHTFTNIDNVQGVSIERTRILLKDSQGTIWGGSSNGVWKMDTMGKMALFTADKSGHKVDKIRAIYELAPNQLLVGNADHLYRFDGSDFTEVNDEYGKAVGASMIGAFQGKIIIGTYERGWKVYDHGQGKTFLPHHFTNTVITYRFIDDNKGHLLSATSDGLLVATGNTIQKIDTTSGLPHNLVLDMTTDSEKNIWVATPEGLTRLRRVHFKITIKKLT